MLASRLRDIARDLVAENDRFGLIQLLSAARDLSASREQIKESGYRARAAELREFASEVLKNNKFNLYPEGLLNQLRQSDVSQLLPERVARLVISAIPSQNMTKAAASSEFSLYIDSANEILNKCRGLLAFSDAFGVNQYLLSHGMAGFRLIIPRVIFQEHLSPLAKIIEPFDRLFESLGELHTGDPSPPRIVYISTSDPNILLEWAPAAVLGLFGFYITLITAAEKTLNVIRAIKDLRGAGADENAISEIEASLTEKNEEAVKKLIRDELDKINSPVKDKRITELKEKVTIYSWNVSSAIVKGARISFDEMQIATDKEDVDILTPSSEHVMSLVEQQKHIEARIDSLTSNIGQQILLIEAPAIQVVRAEKKTKSE